ncbi:hypothetical protein BDF20DRAFT_999607 [Mycotypha africana]|uniref:uncharacterized protein n=1 Tax=Mycotypha africana TaxID=64632 RepID=UPI002301AEBC|nr:uncharacterized protein BDF20DRAFT_999607 [Mycotypha africana]KAI8984654.1 hypothetical protein BDF20DRAFT_999607 [Mycotypha africana]
MSLQQQPQQQSPMLLVQPLKLDEINLKMDEPEEDQEEQAQKAAITPIDVIDDVELLAILGLPTPTPTVISTDFSTMMSNNNNGPNFLASSPCCNTPALTDENAFLDWDDMPELSEGEEEPDTASLTPNSRKRKSSYDDEDIFAELDFEDAILYPAAAGTTTDATTAHTTSTSTSTTTSPAPSLQLPPTKKRFVQEQMINPISNAV